MSDPFDALFSQYESVTREKSSKPAISFSKKKSKESSSLELNVTVSAQPVDNAGVRKRLRNKGKPRPPVNHSEVALNEDTNAELLLLKAADNLSKQSAAPTEAGTRKKQGVALAGLPLRTVACKFFMEGICKKSAEECSFSHDFIPNKTSEQVMKSQLCKFIIRKACLKGDACPYSHDVSMIPCRFYSTFGNCREGEKCPFSHAYKGPSSPAVQGNSIADPLVDSFSESYHQVEASYTYDQYLPSSYDYQFQPPTTRQFSYDNAGHLIEPPLNHDTCNAYDNFSTETIHHPTEPDILYDPFLITD